MVYPELSASDNYAASQRLGEDVRARGDAGIIYDSIRHLGGTNVVAYHPRNVNDVVEADHFEITVEAASSRINAKGLNGL
jgi:hypothetical protein